MDEEFTDMGDYEAVKFYEDFGVSVDRAASGNFIIGIVVPEVDEKGVPVEQVLYTSITSAEKLLRDLTECIEAAKGFDKEHNGPGATSPDAP